MRWLIHFDPDVRRWYVCLTGDQAALGHEERFDAATWAEACLWLRRTLHAQSQVNATLTILNACKL